MREWWNTAPLPFATPRQHLFEQLGLGRDGQPGLHRVGQGVVLFRAGNPATLATQPEGGCTLIAALQPALRETRVRWRETNYLLLRRGPYVIAAGLKESTEGPGKVLRGPFIDLFDAELSLQETVTWSADLPSAFGRARPRVPGGEAIVNLVVFSEAFPLWLTPQAP